MARYKKDFLYAYLKENYSKKRKSEIINDLNLSWNYIQKKACLFGIKRDFNEVTNRTYKLDKFLDFDNISCYWIGFIFADGHFNSNNNIQIGLSKDDLNHLKKLEDHFGFTMNVYENKNNNSVNITLSDSFVVRKLIDLFKIKSNKTKHPPIIPDFITNEKLFSLIIGFIDGDGSVTNKGTLRIKSDLSWKNMVEYFYFVLTNEKKIFNLTSDSLSQIYISKKRVLKKIKQKALELELPILDRKWNKIKTNSIIDNCVFCGKVLQGDSSKIYCDAKCQYLSKRDSIKEKDFKRELKY